MIFKLLQPNFYDSHVKVTHINFSGKRINPFGGINLVVKAMFKRGIAVMIDDHLGERVQQAKYSYSDIILSWVYANLSGAERLEDNQHFRSYMNDIPGVKSPSSDRISQVFRSLATETTVYQENEVNHEFSIPERLNTLMLDISMELGMLNNCSGYTVDYDNVIIDTEKYDSRKTYEDYKYGYQPGVSFIGKVPVYIEGRNGNSVASYRITDTIKRTLSLLKSKGVKVSRFRSDAAAYTNNLMEFLTRENIDFFLRVHNRKAFKEQVQVPTLTWEKAFIGTYEEEISSFDYYPVRYYTDKPQRVVVSRNMTSAGYRYRGVITNNLTMSDLEVLKFYNQRGAIERNFDDLKNNFNWRRLPFSFLNENTVFMIISAIASIIYQYIVKKFSKVVDFVKKNGRLKNFIFNFITVAAEWIDDDTLVMYTDKDYAILLEE